MKENIHESILLEGLKEGNAKIFDYLFHLYYSGLVHFSMRYVNEKEVAEDLVQDFFLKLWNDKHKLEINLTLKSYFFTSIKNRSLDYLKHQQVRNKAGDYFKEMAEVQTSVEENYLVESELRERIELALTKLPEKCRQVFVMNRFEELKPSEIAKRENISIRTVEAHIGKALKILRAELELYLPASLVLIVIDSLKDFMK